MYRSLHFRFLFALFVLFTLFGAGCVYDSEHLNALKCSQEGQRKGDAICRDNLWIHDPVDASEPLDADANTDVLEPPLDADEGSQDSGVDAATDATDDGDSGTQDSGPSDVDESDADSSEPDADEPDVDEPDADESDADESDVDDPDAGGEIGDSCNESSECTSNYCGPEGVCGVDPCTNGVLDPGEVDVDCGGTCSNQCQGYLQVAAGSVHTCAINAHNRVTCWGSGTASQLPQTLRNTEFSWISAGQEHTCAIRVDDQQVVCWGKANNDRLAVGASAFSSISLGKEHACGIKTDTTIHCWGKDNDGSVNGRPDSNSSSWTRVTVGEEHSCANKADGTFSCWGRSSNNRINFTSTELFSSMAAGKQHTCAIKRADDTMECVGNNAVAVPTINSSDRYVFVDARDNYACAIRENDTVFCWGSENNNRIANHPETTKFTQLSTGWEHACAITKDDGLIQCWGNRSNDRYPEDFEL